MAKRTEMLRFHNGSIVTMDPNDPVAGELVTRNGRIAWLGRQGSAPPEFNRAKTIDSEWTAPSARLLRCPHALSLFLENSP
jgi:predicted amidohydrolase YtcJ